MTLRRRVALFLDPTLIEKPETQPYEALPWLLGDRYREAQQLERIAKSLDYLSRRTRRRPRIIVCEHQDTHPEWGQS